MICQRCNNLLQSHLKRCLDCYEDGIQDADMCESCFNEHLEANEYPVRSIEVKY